MCCSQGCTLSQASYPNEPGYSHIHRRHALLKTPFYVCPRGNLLETAVHVCRSTTPLITIVLPGDVSRLGWTRKDKDCITLFIIVFVFLIIGSLIN